MLRLTVNPRRFCLYWVDIDSGVRLRSDPPSAELNAARWALHRALVRNGHRLHELFILPNFLEDKQNRPPSMQATLVHVPKVRMLNIDSPWALESLASTPLVHFETLNVLLRNGEFQPVLLQPLVDTLTKVFAFGTGTLLGSSLGQKWTSAVVPSLRSVVIWEESLDGANENVRRVADFLSDRGVALVDQIGRPPTSCRDWEPESFESLSLN